MPDDPHDLQRFVLAQDRDDIYEQAVAELRAGRKQSHWMWFVLPQRSGLGHSAMAQEYGIASDAEARAYVDHPILGARLRETARALLDGPQDDAVQLLGSVDAMKLRSSMALFAEVAPEEPLFAQVTERFFAA